jgi:hypothetical protein
MAFKIIKLFRLKNAETGERRQKAGKPGSFGRETPPFGRQFAPTQCIKNSTFSLISDICGGPGRNAVSATENIAISTT